jgi:hypothetical protein
MVLNWFSEHGVSLETCGRLNERDSACSAKIESASAMKGGDLGVGRTAYRSVDLPS